MGVGAGSEGRKVKLADPSDWAHRVRGRGKAKMQARVDEMSNGRQETRIAKSNMAEQSCPKEVIMKIYFSFPSIVTSNKKRKQSTKKEQTWARRRLFA